MDIVIKSDGTKEGTSFTVNGKDVKPKSAALFLSQWNDHVEFSYSTEAKKKDQGVRIYTTYTYDPCLATLAASHIEVDENEVIEPSQFEQM